MVEPYHRASSPHALTGSYCNCTCSEEQGEHIREDVSVTLFDGCSFDLQGYGHALIVIKSCVIILFQM